MDRNYQQKKQRSRWQGSENDAVLTRILENRGATSEADITYLFTQLPHFNRFKYIQDAAAVIGDAVMSKRDICIVGDYDADGATSCALMMLMLRDFGANVRFIVPNRATDGYGLSVGLLGRLHKNPDLIITVDNGISSVQACGHAKELGIDVVITDHHLPPASLPEARAIVNPNLEDETFEDKSLAGVGVAWYVLVAVRAYLKDQGHFENMAIPNCADYLDLVALGTVADLVPLSYLNRLLISQGLLRINQKPRPGIRALLFVANKTDHTILAKDLGFALGPRLNAAGRLEDMTIGIRCLLSSTLEEGLAYANQLEGLNDRRKHLEKKAIDVVINNLKSEKSTGLVVYDPAWHEGVIGLVASRIKEETNKPVVAMTNGGEGKIKGSARSVKGVHIRDLLVNVSLKNPGLLESFGGHAMAAGLTIASDNLDIFRTSFQQELDIVLAGEALANELFYDLSLPPSHLSLSFARQLATITPWGQGFEEPVFHGVFQLLDQRELKGGVYKFSFMLGDRVVEGIRFRNYSQNTWQIGQMYDVYYLLDINRFRGLDRLQLIVMDLVFSSQTVEPA